MASIPGDGVRLMGIVNATPDSFADGGRYLDPGAAIAHGLELIESGAAIVDVGGESTRPGHEAVDPAVELERVVPVVAGLADAGVPISVDTTKASVAAAALDAGAAIVNDVSALQGDPEMAELCGERGAIVVLMHGYEAGNRPTASSSGDAIDAVKTFLDQRVEAARDAGIDERRIWLDPGVGFGKVNPEENLEVVRRLGELRELGLPIVVGTSRKSFIGCLDGSPPGERLGGTVASSLAAALRGADVLRVHDVAAMSQALQVAALTLGNDAIGPLVGPPVAFALDVVAGRLAQVGSADHE